MKKTLIIRFQISGNLRYLSHLETMAMFRRAFTRMDMNLCYSSGFNPRPRISLPLPRSVALQSDDEMLCVLVESEETDSAKQAQERIAAAVPEGCRIISVEIDDEKTSFAALGATYRFPVGDPAGDEKMTAAADGLQRRLDAGSAINIERQGRKGKPVRQMDVSVYLDSVRYMESSFIVKCGITPSGTIRIDEIMKLLELDYSQLSGPVTRSSVRWARN